MAYDEEDLLKSINDLKSHMPLLESQIIDREQRVSTLSIKAKGYLQMFIAFLDQGIPWENFSQIWMDLIRIFGTEQYGRGQYQLETEMLSNDIESLAKDKIELEILKGDLSELKKEDS